MRTIGEAKADGPVKSHQKWWTLAVIGSGTFMSALDTSIVNIALPVIRETTRAAVSTVEWVALAYLITVSASLLFFGRLADIHGRRRIYMTGQTVFVVGSLACGLSGHIAGLIAARALQAIGAAMIFALSPAILISAFPANERGRALGLQATLTYLGMSLGPGLGGLLIEHWGWPSIFYVNVPIGLVMLGVARRTLATDRSATAQRQPFDPAGAAALAVTLATLLFALSKGGDLGWQHPLILGGLSAAFCAGAVFVAIERGNPHPVLDLSLFLNRTFSAAVLAAFLCYLVSAAVAFLMPFFLLSAAGYAASRAGLILMAVPLGMMFLTAPSGWLSDKVGVRLPATLGMAVMAASIALLGTLQTNDPPLRIAACLLATGLGAGLFTAPNNSAIMGAVPFGRRGVAGAILAAARTVGFSSGIAWAGILYLGCQTGDTRGSSEDLVRAVQTALRLTALIALAGMICSALRGTPSGRQEQG